MNKCVIEIAPNGESQLRLVLNSEILKTPTAGMPFSRPRASPLVADQLQRLRFGDAPDELVKEITSKISEWILGQDLGGQITTAINLSEGGDPIRLVFSVNDEELREMLADIPFELIVQKESVDPLVLNPRIASIVHLLNKVGTPAPRRSNWPLKILIVRSNPPDASGLIPPAEPIRQFILKILTDNPPLSPELVKIDILSSEVAPNLAGPPTPEALEAQLPKVEYDILIYFGHGDISSAVSPGKKIGGVLQLEDEKGERHRVLEARTLARMLGEPNPVPVVLLLGCLTATEAISEEKMEGVRELLPQWLRGSQGLAQVLINSESGVQFVVGMRYKIDTEDATDFLNFFFRNLLMVRRGNVEAAVRSARRKLADKSYMWSAPVIFSTLGDEPMFPFMEELPDCPNVDGSEKFRKSVWKNLSKAKWGQRDTDFFKEMVPDWLQSLRDSEREIVEKMEQHKATLIMPGFGEFKVGNEIRVPVKLIGSLKNVEEIEGKIEVGAGPPPITGLQASQHLLNNNFQLNALDNNSGFLIRAGKAATLGSGDLFEMVMSVPAETHGVLQVNVTKIRTKPPMKVCAVGNGIVMPLP